MHMGGREREERDRQTAAAYGLAVWCVIAKSDLQRKGRDVLIGGLLSPTRERRRAE